MSDPELMRAREGHHYDRHRKAVRDWAIIALSLAVLAVIAVGTVQLIAGRDEANQGKQEAEQGQQDLAALVLVGCRSGGEARKKLDAIGACQTARGVVESAPAVEPPAPLAPSDAQVRAAVETYFDRNPPADGHTPTAAEVDAAVKRFCAAQACQGKNGVDGTDGTNGTNGTNGADGTNGVDGEDGPPPSAEAVAAAVADYCGQASEPCRSREGPTQQQVNDYCAANPNACRPDPPERLSWVDAAGQQQSCTRDPSSPDGTPANTYSCTAPPIQIVEVP